MGQKTTMSQRRGAARPKYTASMKLGVSNTKHLKDITSSSVEFLDFKVNPLKTALLAKIKIKTAEGTETNDWMIAPTGAYVGLVVENSSHPIHIGATMQLKDVPEGVKVYNIENKIGDGGQFCRSGSTSAIVRRKNENSILLKLPSGVVREFSPRCLATIGVPAGGNRSIKPLLKAGNKFHAVKRRCIEWPYTSRNSKNVKDHRFGGSGKKRPGSCTVSSRHAPPGRKVGAIAAKRTGYGKSK